MHVRLNQYCTFDYNIKCQIFFDALCTGYFLTNALCVQVDKTPANSDHPSLYMKFSRGFQNMKYSLL